MGAVQCVPPDDGGEEVALEFLLLLVVYLIGVV